MIHPARLDAFAWPRGQQQAAEDHRGAQPVIDLQTLVQQHPAQQRGEYRHHVVGQRRLGRTDHADAVVLGQVGQQRGEYGGVGDGREVGDVERQMRALAQLI